MVKLSRLSGLVKRSAFWPLEELCSMKIEFLAIFCGRMSGAGK